MYIGIDFGTTESKVATMYLGQPLLLQNPGEYGTPSEFYYDKDSGILIGQDALDAGQGEAAVNLVSEVKMAIRSGKAFTLDGRPFSAKEIVKEIYHTLIIKAIRVAKKRPIQVDLEGVVISVPAGFTMQERALIADAARECMEETRIPIRSIIQEPVAASLAYYDTSMENNRYILVYDLGGGTADVALVRADSSKAEYYTVVDSDMIRVGGRDWDRLLAEHITKSIEEKSGITIGDDAGSREKIRRAAISVKHALSDPDHPQATARVELNGRIYTTVVTRTEFDRITAHLLKETLDCLQEVYERNQAECQIDEIICVGGGSNMLQVEEGICARFPQCTVRLYEPEHAVVYGAALYASMPQTNVLVNRASFSYGTDSNSHYGHADNREIVSNILMQGAELPAVASRGYRPVRDNQKAVTFNIYESEHTEDTYDLSAQDKRLIGYVELPLPEGATTGLKLQCQLSLNADGMLEVVASEAGGEKVEATFHLLEL